MIIWINGPYGVGKTTLAEALCELRPHSFLFDAEAVGNAVRDNLPEALFQGWLFESYPMWFRMCTELLADLAGRYDGDIFVPMTLILPDSFEKMERPLKARGIAVRHVLLESSYAVVHDRILARGETEDCWCMQQIDLCLKNQGTFENAIRVPSLGKSPQELALEVQRAAGLR